MLSIHQSFVTLHLLVSELNVLPEVLFYENYIVYYNVYCYYCGVFIEEYVCTKFHLNWSVSYMAIYEPIGSCLLLFYKNYIVYQM